MQVHFHLCINFSFVFIMVQSFERRKKKRVPHFHRRIERTYGVDNDFLRMLGISFCFSSSSLFGTTFGQSGGFSTRSTPSWISVVFPWIIDGPSHSAPHVPLYHYAALRRASITSHH